MSSKHSSAPPAEVIGRHAQGNSRKAARAGESYPRAYVGAVKMIKAGQDKDFFEAKAKEFFNLSMPEQIAAGIKQNRQNFADLWGDSFFQSQNKILQSGISLGLLPKVNLNELWVK